MVTLLRRIIVTGLALGLHAACGDTSIGSRGDTDETPDVETNDTLDVESVIGMISAADRSPQKAGTH